MTEHAKLSASSSHRWAICPGSIKAEEGLEESKSPFAQEGSVAHELAEMCLTKGHFPDDYLGKVIDGIEVDSEMVEAIQDYIDIIKLTGGQQSYEQRVDFSEWVPDGFGTADCISVNAHQLTIVDLKYGKGVKVDAKDNSQMMLYALGAYDQYSAFSDFTQVKMIIVQPRIENVSEHTIKVDDLLQWGEWIKERAHAALKPDAPRVPGESQCRFCKAKPTCPALYELTKKLIQCEFDNLDGLDAPSKLDDNQLRTVLDNKTLIESWLNAVKDHVTQHLEAGQRFKGYKLVSGRSNRKWSDDSEAESKLTELLQDAAYEKTLLSPAKAEKVLGKKRKDLITDLIVKPEGKPILAPETDKRPAVSVSTDDFVEVTD